MFFVGKEENLMVMKKIILALLLSAFYFAGFAQYPVFRTEEQNKPLEMKVYPNPCKSDKVTIESSGNEITEISITNIAGKQVLLKKFSDPGNKKQIELTEVPNGIYLIKIRTDNNKQSVKKLIVTKE